MTAKALTVEHDVHGIPVCPFSAAMLPVPPLREEQAPEYRRAAPHRVPGDVGPTSDARRTLARFVTVSTDRLPSQAAVQDAVAAALGADGLAMIAASFADPAALARSRRRLSTAIPRGPRTRSTGAP